MAQVVGRKFSAILGFESASDAQRAALTALVSILTVAVVLTLVLVVLVLAWLMYTYNRLVRLRNQSRTASGSSPRRSGPPSMTTRARSGSSRGRGKRQPLLDARIGRGIAVVMGPFQPLAH